MKNFKSAKCLKYLNDHKVALFEHRRLLYRDMVYWANMTRMEIYARSLDADINGCINGYKVADITSDFEIVEGRND